MSAYCVEVIVPDQLLAEVSGVDLDRFQLEFGQPGFLAWKPFGFTERPEKMEQWRYPVEDETIVAFWTDEVVKPTLFGRELKYRVARV